jgi:plasmid replication initiation protein
MEKELSVTKSNALIESAYRLSLTEMQVVLYGISLINPVQKIFPLTYRIDINRFSEIFNRAHKDIYTEVKDAVIKRLWERDFSYIDKDGNTVTLRWLTKITYEDKSGYLEIKFSEEIQPYLHELHNNFTKYYISEISKFKSIYSIRLYEYSIMNLNKHETNKYKFCLLIDDIKKRLAIDEKYIRF